MASSAEIDFRTRFDGSASPIAPAGFFDQELPRRLREATDLLASTDGLDLRPLVVRVGDAAWRLERTDGRIQAGRWEGEGGAEVRLEPEWLSDLLSDQTTPVGLLTSGRLDLRGAGIGRLLDWWLVLRCVLDGRPVHTAGAFDLPERLDRSFTLADDPAELFAFLTTAGFLHVRGVFTEAEMADVSADMDAAAATYRPGDGASWWATLADGSERLVRMQHFDERSPATAALLADGRLTRIAAAVDERYALRRPGDNRIEALFKPIGVEQGISDVPWHKDCSLGRHSYECCRLTVGISVTGAGPGSGQLRVVAGSHRALVWPSLLDPATTGLPVLPLATGTGDVTVHLSCTLHMAEPPTTAERRVLYTDFVLPARDPEAAEEWRRRLIELREQAPLNTSQPPASQA